MDLSEFSKFIFSISSELWGKNLMIGKFKELAIDDIVRRKYSYVAKCHISGTNSDYRAYVKLYRKFRKISPESLAQQVRKEYETIDHYFHKFSQSDQFNVIKPLFVIPDKFILTTEEAVGDNLYGFIEKYDIFSRAKKNEERLTKYLFQVGKWLEYFHSLEQPVSKEYTIDELIDYVKIRFEILTEDKRRHFPEVYCKKILDFIENNKLEVTKRELKTCLSHSDFNLGNIIVNGKRVTVLDFTKIKIDSFLLDVSRIYHQLFLLTFKPQYKIKAIQRLQRALLEGFGMEHADRLMLFRFLLIRHTVTHLVGITRFWEVGFKERLYNYWVLHKGLNYLNHLMNSEFASER